MNARKYLLGPLLLAGLPFAAGAAPERVPAWLVSKSGGEAPPVWISAAAAVDDETVLKWDLLVDDTLKSTVQSQRQSLQKRGIPVEGVDGFQIRSIAAEDCRSGILFSHMFENQPSGSLDDLLRFSRAIVRGTVRAVEPGIFYGKLVGSLLQVQVEEVLRDAHEYGRSPSLYVYYPSGYFAVGPYRFCGHSTGHEAKIGDRVLVFDFYGPKDRNGSLLIPRDSQVFFETPDGLLFLPREMSQDPALKSVNSLQGLAETVRRAPYSGEPEKLDPNLIF